MTSTYVFDMGDNGFEAFYRAEWAQWLGHTCCICQQVMTDEQTMTASIFAGFGADGTTRYLAHKSCWSGFSKTVQRLHAIGQLTLVIGPSASPDPFPPSPEN